MSHDAEIQRQLEQLRQNVTPALVHIRSKAECFSVLKSALSTSSGVMKSIAERGDLRHQEGQALMFAQAVIGSIVRTLEASPMYDSDVLAHQLLHGLEQHLRDATVSKFRAKDPAPSEHS